MKRALVQSHGRISGPAGAAAKLGVPDSTLEGKNKAPGNRTNIDLSPRRSNADDSVLGLLPGLYPSWRFTRPEGNPENPRSVIAHNSLVLNGLLNGRFRASWSCVSETAARSSSFLRAERIVVIGASALHLHQGIWGPTT